LTSTTIVESQISNSGPEIQKDILECHLDVITYGRAVFAAKNEEIRLTERQDVGRVTGDIVPVDTHNVRAFPRNSCSNEEVSDIPLLSFSNVP
jgi:hypothetical protein